MELNRKAINEKRFKPYSKYVAVDFDDRINTYLILSSVSAYMKKVEEQGRKCWYLGETDSEGKFYLKEKEND